MRARNVAFASILICAVAVDHGMRGRLLAAETELVEPVHKHIENHPIHKYPVPTTQRCIINIVIQYMIVYLALALVRTYHNVSGKPRGTLEAALGAASQTLSLGPMLCVLFLACRMLVLGLSHGKDDPQIWVQVCMYVCTYTLLASTCVVLMMPVVTAVPSVHNTTGDIEADLKEMEERLMAMYILLALRYLIFICMYVGVGGVLVGMCMYEPPAGTWPGDKIPPPAPSIVCTVILSVAFFTLFACITIARSYAQLSGQSGMTLEGVLLGAARTMELAPMLCILFLATRMRALQMDPVHGAPQMWTQAFFYICTCAVLIQSIFAIAVPLTITTELERDHHGNVMFRVAERPTLGYILMACRGAIMLCLYVGFTAVVVSIFLIEHPKGAKHTPPLSPAVQCVINLTLQFFFIYLLLWIMITVHELSGNSVKEMQFFAAVVSARAMVKFAPMIAVLFVAARLRALHITDNKGAPQPWAQSAMFTATWAMLVSLVMCFVVAIFLDVRVDEDDNVVSSYESKWLAIPIITVRYLAILVMYGGASTVIVSIFVITPETATGV
eukprot:gnl/TRDRNA2_/TRDRNA2_70185_c0_seq1.p1 gnl/TRDRNA2_/TRDRNA2_70185_c0~~gnl/TRDRNA2_/TRDRNA2_70185_c0_seq1.p1  ORF type:complete len:557 (-),score=73.17 gnl/TRDRNA2_/TRDRNA2_70185_c0_seq1:44-1714(-)